VNIAELITIKNDNFNPVRYRELVSKDTIYQLDLDLMATNVTRAVSLIEDYFLEQVEDEVDLSPMLAVKNKDQSLEIIYVPLGDFAYTYNDDNGHSNCHILVNAIEAYFKAAIFRV
jgi:hypothetical protein